MKWMRLKVYLLPTFMQEIDSVTERYINLINELRRDTTSREILEEFIDLRENIAKRIEEIENFYEDNIGDSKVLNFEKGRIKLKKLLMYDPDMMNRLDGPDSNVFRGLVFSYNNEIPCNIIQKSSPMKQKDNYLNDGMITDSLNEMIPTSKVTQANKQNEISLKTKNEQDKPPSQAGMKAVTASAKKPVITSSTNNKAKPSTIPNKTISSGKNVKKMNETISFTSNMNNMNSNIADTKSKYSTNKKNLLTNEIEPEIIEVDNLNPNIGENYSNTMSKNLASFGQLPEDDHWKELVFRIKLNEGEYKLLLREKAKMVLLNVNK